DAHYDILSALQKSIRGSDENAALHYAARLLEADDLISLTRRLLVIASEDVGLAYPMAPVIVKACVDNALALGLPEARIPIAEAVVLLATAPKSNSAEQAIDAAIADLQKYGPLDFPRHLQNKHYDGEGAAVRGQHYLYPHDYPNHYVRQQYLPDAIADHVYYQFGDNKNEQAALMYRRKILEGSK
ncbi:MAG: replication-associated recombination protein A, partial [Oscillospiraceae bacterium]|nr:replication-associated recombination protein A [Oscillospiraceae bacterium]